MTIQVGDKIPSVKLKHLTSNGMQEVSTDELFGGKKAVLFAVPGAFTPTCSAKHLPGFVDRIDEFKAKGYEVVCMAVNDPFVMEAWGKSANVGDKILMLPDGNGDLTRALGLEMDGSGYNLGQRRHRGRSVRMATSTLVGNVVSAFAQERRPTYGTNHSPVPLV